MQFDQPKRREPTKPKLPPAPLLWLLGGVAVALAALPAIFDGSPASTQDEALTVLTASSMQSKQDEALTVLAASSMQNALDDINAAFTTSTGVKVIAGYRASSTAIKQIAQGAAADVFDSDDLDWMDWGLQKKLIKDARVNLLGNRLVLIGRQRIPNSIVSRSARTSILPSSRGTVRLPSPKYRTCRPVDTPRRRWRPSERGKPPRQNS